MFQRARRGLAAARCEQFGELLRHPIALALQGDPQRRPVGIVESARDAFAIQWIVRQGVGLRVAQHLQAVFQPAQITIRLAQRGAIALDHLAGRDQRAQRRHQPTLAQRRLAAAADQLQRLHQEFDFADATRAALDVVGQFAACHFRGDRGLHLAQSVQRGVVQVAAVDERAQAFQPALARLDVAGDRARLQPSVAFPVAPFALEVLVHAGERQRYPPRIAERAQAQIHAVAETVHRRFVQQFRQALSEPGEVILRRQRTRAIGLAVVRERVHQIHVGGKIQFAAAELAEAEHHQPLHAAVGGAHHAMALGEFGFQRFQADAQAVFRQPRAAGEDGVDVIQSQHVTPDQAGRFGGAIAPQLFLPASGFIGCQDRRGRRRGAVVAEQGVQPVRLASQGFQGEVAGQDHLADARGAGGIGEQRGRSGRGFAQAGQAAFDQGIEIGVETGVVIHIAGLWHCPVFVCGSDVGRDRKTDAQANLCFPFSACTLWEEAEGKGNGRDSRRSHKGATGLPQAASERSGRAVSRRRSRPKCAASFSSRTGLTCSRPEGPPRSDRVATCKPW